MTKVTICCRLDRLQQLYRLHPFRSTLVGLEWMYSTTGWTVTLHSKSGQVGQRLSRPGQSQDGFRSPRVSGITALYHSNIGAREYDVAVLYVIFTLP
jgi:hypothetical protein